MWARCLAFLENVRCRRKTVKLTAWELWPQGLNLKKLAGEHHKGWSLRFNWIQRRTSHRGRRQSEGQVDDFAGLAERWCMAAVSSCCEMSCQVRQRARPSPLVAIGSLRMPGTLRGPLAISQRKERATVGPYAPNPPGNTRATMHRTEGCDPERGSQSLNLCSVRIEGCNPPS